MDLKSAILEEHSKSSSQRIAIYIGNSPQRFDELMNCVLSPDEELARRAAWVLSYCCDEDPSLAEPYLPQLIERLWNRALHQGIRRNIVRTLQTAPLPERLKGEIFNGCFDLLTDPDEANAIRVFSMTVLTRICESESDAVELAREVKLAIESQIRGGTPAFKSRAKRELRKLTAITNS